MKKKKKGWKKARAKLLIEKWKRLLYLENFYTETEFKKGEGPNGELATIFPDLTYKQAKIVIYDAFFTRADQEQIIVHELCHFLTQPTRQVASDTLNAKSPLWRQFDEANEHETEWVSGIIWRIHNRNKK